MNAIKYLLIIFFIFIGCQESNNKDLYNSSIEHKSSIKIVEQEPLSSYSKCLSMLKEYESILDELLFSFDSDKILFKFKTANL